jgi:hypothetical protein
MTTSCAPYTRRALLVAGLIVYMAFVFAIFITQADTGPWRVYVYAIWLPLALLAPKMGMLFERAAQEARDEEAAHRALERRNRTSVARAAWDAQAHPMSTLDDTVAHLTTYMYANWPPALGKYEVARRQGPSGGDPVGAVVLVDREALLLCGALLHHFRRAYNPCVPLSVVQRMGPVVQP